ncbi:MAG: lytic transglycosylase domain-containing protein [Armatimonadota bacterium]
MSFDIDFQPKGPEAVRQRMDEIRERLGVKDPDEFKKAMKEAAKPPMRMQGYIGNGTPDLHMEDGLAPFDPGRPGSKVQVQAMIERVAREQDIDPKIIRAVVEAESDYKINDVSRTGAKGLMQLMPDTAREMGVTNPFDPYENLTGGTKYLKQMIARYPGRLDLAFAAYNAGPGNVDKAKGIPDFAETRNYVDKITAKLNRR